MVAHKPIRVRAKTGHFVVWRGSDSMTVRYIGRKYDPKGDRTSLESEFPILPAGEEVASVDYIRKAIRDGELEVVTQKPEAK